LACFLVGRASGTATAACNGQILNAGGELYNAMLHPFTVGPISLRTLAFYQGESFESFAHVAL
jgi:hypothetical protein